VSLIRNHNRRILSRIKQTYYRQSGNFATLYLFYKKPVHVPVENSINKNYQTPLSNIKTTHPLSDCLCLLLHVTHDHYILFDVNARDWWKWWRQICLPRWLVDSQHWFLTSDVIPLQCLVSSNASFSMVYFCAKIYPLCSNIVRTLNLIFSFAAIVPISRLVK
jgi:hypothetical protein